MGVMGICLIDDGQDRGRFPRMAIDWRKRLTDELSRQKRDMKEVSLAAGLGETYIRDALKRGRGGKIENLQRIAIALGHPANWLIGGPIVSSFDPDEREPYGEGGTDRPDLPHGVTNDGAATLTIPKGGVAEIDVEPGLGGGGLTAETYVRTPDGNQFPADAIRGIWQLPDHVFTQMRARSQNVRCFPVQGDSMLDTLDEGDFVFVDVAHKVPSPPGIYALDDGFGGIIVKRLEVVDEDDGEPIVRVISDNERYAERRERAENLRIVGRYIAMFTMRNRR
jgi:hypothetical protein